MPDMPAGHHDRFNPAKSYDRHLFRSGKVLQNAELNEVQSSLIARVQSVGDSLFKDGDIVRDCVVYVDPDTGAVTCGSGAVYLDGAVRGVGTGNFTIPTVGTFAIGIRLNETVVSELEDPELLDPAVGLRNYGQPGAHRLKVEPVWGWDGDGSASRFFPMFTADNAVLRAKAPPPAFDAVQQAIAKYDRDSAGGTYVVSGMNVQKLADDGANQVYAIADGSVRLRGNSLEFPSARRLIVDPEPDLRFIDDEPHVSTGTAAQRVDLNLGPVANITEVTITAQGSETVTRGAVVGGSDQITQTSVLSIVSVVQGGTTYVQGVDYQLTAGKVDWSLAGAEPATGSTYTVTYQFIDNVEPTDVDASGCTVTGAISGTLILVSYNQYLPRFDRICVAENGTIRLLKGVAAAWNPTVPEVPDSMLALATVYQSWTADRTVTNDGVRVVPMNDLAQLNERMDEILSLVARQQLESSVNSRETGSIKGLFVDPFADNAMRDAGIAQTAAVVDGTLNLPMAITTHDADGRAGGSSALTFNSVTTGMVQQLARTGSMKVNPYFSFVVPPPAPAPTPSEGGSNTGAESPPINVTVPPVLRLSPNVDRWLDIENQIGNDEAWAWVRLANRGGQVQIVPASEVTDPSTIIGGQIFNRRRVQRRIEAVARQRQIQFTALGFKQGEQLAEVLFDGLVCITSGPFVYATEGTIPYAQAFLTIPAGVTPGTKQVVVVGDQGTRVIGSYTVLSPLEVPEAEWVRVRDRRIDPLAQTFTLEAAQHLSGVDLWFTAVGTTEVVVQILETANGVPTQRILAESRLQPAAITTDGTLTRFNFAHPVPLAAGVEYAVVVLCDDSVTECAIAELGKQDTVTSQWVTSQPYMVGVLLSSSNASTWTPHQDRDLTFRLVGAAFTANTRTLALGTVSVTAATDLLVRAAVQSPAANCTCRFSLTMPDASVHYIAADQPLRLDAAVTGDIVVAAILDGAADASPILHPGVQLLAGATDTTGDYASRAFTGGTAVTVKTVVEVELPGTATVGVAFKGSADGAWTDQTGPTAVALADGWTELTYTTAGVTKPLLQSKLTLSGSPQYRPRARNLRVSVV